MDRETQVLEAEARGETAEKATAPAPALYITFDRCP